MAWQIDEVLRAIDSKLTARGIDEVTRKNQLAYHSAALHELQATYDPAPPAPSVATGGFDSMGFLGMGGSGVVLLLQNTKGSPTRKCLKYPHPTVGQPDVQFSLAEILESEAAALQSLPHQHIIPIDEIGAVHLPSSQSYTARDEKVPYYLMPFVDAIDLQQYAASPHATPRGGTCQRF